LPSGSGTSPQWTKRATSFFRTVSAGDRALGGVSGFTVLSERLEPEQVSDIMHQTFDIVLETVHEHGGTVNQFLGDGVMALFADAPLRAPRLPSAERRRSPARAPRTGAA